MRAVFSQIPREVAERYPRLQRRKSGLRPDVAGADAKDSAVHRRISASSATASGSETTVGSGRELSSLGSSDEASDADSIENVVM